MDRMRPNAADIRRLRNNHRHGVLVTGCTGFVGSHLMAELLRRGYSVIAVSRAKKDMGATERIRRLLRWHNVHDIDNLTIVDGDITALGLGLNREYYAKVCAMTGEIWHCASDTSFAEEKRDHVTKVNVEGTRNVLKLALDSECFFFHHMSTAYAAGKTGGVCREEHVQQDAFYNVYERTKHEAEGHVLEVCREHGIKAHIYRPSIIIGDSKSGRSLLFTGFYYVPRSVHLLKNLFERDIKLMQGVNAQKMGVRLTKEGHLYLPIRFGYLHKCGLNLVPIDFVVEACISIMENCLDNGIFNIVNAHPSSMPDLVSLGSSFLGIQGLQAVLESEFTTSPHTALERRVYSILDTYKPYLCDERVFASSNTDTILGPYGIFCPRVEDGVFHRCLQYALKVDWGHGLFKAEQE